MSRSRGAATGLLSRAATALAAMLILAAVAAASAQAATWHLSGNAFPAEGTFLVDGTHEMEIPDLNTTLVCDETGYGTLPASSSPSQETSLNLTLECEMTGHKECIIDPIEWHFSGPGKTLTPNPASYILISEECPLFIDELKQWAPTLSVEYGADAVSVAVTYSGETWFNEFNPKHAVHHLGSSTWTLTGAYYGQQWGFGQAVFAFKLAFGEWGSGNGQLKNPHGIATDAAGNVWVVDTSNKRIQKFNSKGEYLSQFGKAGTGNGQFLYPGDIAIDASDNLYVADEEIERIQKFNSKGEYLSQIEQKGAWFGPAGLTIDASGNILVADAGVSAIKKFNSKGEYLSQFGKAGSGNGEFKYPSDVAVDALGNIWVADTYNHRIQKFNSKGEYLSQFGKAGSGNGQFNLPSSLAVDPEGIVWVTDTHNHRIQRLSSTGTYVGELGSPGTGAGQFKVPWRIIVKPDRILVADSGNHRIQKWAP